jgi:hypothetical protein
MIEQDLIVATSIIICAYFVTVFIGAYLIERFLVSFKHSKVKKSEKEKIVKESSRLNKDITGAGRIIGILERSIVFTLGLLGEFGAISFVLAAKSMARFKQLEERQFAEYYLIGTLSSFFLALILALITKSILNYLFPLNS